MSIQLTEETTPLLSTNLPLPKEQIAIKKSKATIWHIIIPLFFIASCAGGMAAPMVELYTLIFCKRYFESIGEFSVIPIEKCAIPEVQSKVAWVAGTIAILIFGSGMLVASFYGALADRKGRVFVQTITMLGYTIFVADFILMSWFPLSSFTILLIYGGPLLNGLMAGGSVMLGNIQAYISDCTLPSEKSRAFGYLMSAVFLGTTIGPICSSFMVKITGTSESVYYATFFIFVLILLYSMFLMPESIDFSVIKNDNDNNTTTNTSSDTSINNASSSIKKETHQEKAKTLIEKLNVISSLKIFYYAKVSYLVPWAGIILAIIQTLIQSASLPPFILYGMLRFGWSSYEGGIYLSVTSVAKLTSTMVILPLVTKIFDASNPKFDIWMIRIGVISDIMRFTLSGLSANTIQYTIAGSLEALSILSQPSLRTLLISMVKPTQVGELMGAMAVVDGIAVFISQLGLTGIYSLTVAFMPNLTFFVCTFLSVIGLLLSLTLKVLSNRRIDLDV